jgi:putative salt-induced outer membrane protein
MQRFIRTTLAAVLAISCAQIATAADDGLKGRAEASFAHTSGNTDTRTLAGQIKGSYEAGANRYFLRGAALYGKTEGVETSSRWLADGRYERGITERFFAFLEASYLKDKFAGFDSKIQAGPGVGYDLIKTDRQLLKLLASVLYTWDNYTDGTDDEYATGKAAGDYSWQITDTLTFKQYADYLVSLEDANVYFVNSLTGLEVKVNANISLGLSYLVAYQNEPPAGAKHADRTFLSSLVVDF